MEEQQFLRFNFQIKTDQYSERGESPKYSAVSEHMVKTRVKADTLIEEMKISALLLCGHKKK